MTEDFPTLDLPAKAIFGRGLRINCPVDAAERMNSAQFRFNSLISESHSRSVAIGKLCLAAERLRFLFRENQLQDLIGMVDHLEV